mmetsp:Transcript_36997/g.57366  ORF Transcript_36997/g.57366 Transcript_36997/m.57366 type:complete len:383 (+) Transcript_36997:349-1497(+)|eukprot:CAMPEP_0117029996 /NCGR_PEP_ID=MMETSP0472-20121206/21668_1 /TAXON_ID=693140 ORGANISM="Tiarina fusus, Strain LIS" /NCGR_SAMPLE_ID=MMETSP0472 /ASSEMBLY_ACC=CAM_ASM_000603 /LENGTH=382 /DNA_ID=CAMNT_0004737907 /DNA_START=308 /DNA_END=1456 /DNA_ORIENTATION=+
MSSSNSNNNTVAQLQNDDGMVIGYSCQEVVEENEVTNVDLIFYIDVASPQGQQEAAIRHMTEALAENVSLRYGVSNGLRCSEPPLDGTSWIVQFTAEPRNFNQVELFDHCREYSFDDVTQDCFVYEALVTGSALGVEEIPDVMAYLEATLKGTSLTQNTPFGVYFLGVPVVDPGASDSGRDNLSPPSNLNEAEKEIPQNDNGQTITIIGGFLLAAFCVAFLGGALVLWRRRRAYMKHNREMHLSLSKSSDPLQQYDTEPHVTISDEEASPSGMKSLSHRSGSPHSPHHNQNPPELSSPTPTEENFPNNITFDLGTSFKDQLMGVHASSGPHRRPHHHNHMMAGPFGTAPSADGTDSDADSWAQTDGTIGSLELQLEPITAEV